MPYDDPYLDHTAKAAQQRRQFEAQGPIHMKGLPVGSVPALGNVSTASKIRDGVSCLEDQIAELHGIIGAVEQRLDTVLAPVPPTNGAGTLGQDLKTPNSHLFDRLGVLNDALQSARIRLADILGRVEV